MSQRAKELVDAFYKRPLNEYREVVLEVRGSGGLDRKELAFIRRRVDPADVELIERHATIAPPGQAEN